MDSRCESAPTLWAQFFPLRHSVMQILRHALRERGAMSAAGPTRSPRWRLPSVVSPLCALRQVLIHCHKKGDTDSEMGCLNDNDRHQILGSG